MSRLVQFCGVDGVLAKRIGVGGKKSPSSVLWSSFKARNPSENQAFT